MFSLRVRETSGICQNGHGDMTRSRIRVDLLLKFDIIKEDRVKVIKNLGRTLLDDLENLFRSYWTHRFGPVVQDRREV